MVLRTTRIAAAVVVVIAGFACTSARHDWSETEQAWAGASNSENELRVFAQRRDEAAQRAEEYAVEEQRMTAIVLERRKSLARVRSETEKLQAELVAAQKALDVVKAENAKVAAEAEAVRARAATRPTK